MAEKKLFADVMREAVATAHYRKVQSVMKKMINSFSTVRFTYIANPDEHTLQILRDEGFTVEDRNITDYKSYKISW